MVEDHKNQMELLDIQGKLEISVPKSAKGCNRKEIKGLSLVAQERKLRKTGEAEWKGHGRHLCKSRERRAVAFRLGTVLLTRVHSYQSSITVSLRVCFHGTFMLYTVIHIELLLFVLVRCS